MYYCRDNTFKNIFLKYIILIYIWDYNEVLMLNNKRKYFLYAHLFFLILKF